MNSQQIQAIRERYKNSLPEKTKVISELIDAIEKPQPDAMENAYNVLHKLAGSSGMYGYDEIADLCRVAMSNARGNNASELGSKLSQLHELLENHA